MRYDCEITDYPEELSVEEIVIEGNTYMGNDIGQGNFNKTIEQGNLLIYSIFKEFSFYLPTKFKRCGFTVPKV